MIKMRNGISSCVALLLMLAFAMNATAKSLPHGMISKEDPNERVFAIELKDGWKGAFSGLEGLKFEYVKDALSGRMILKISDGSEVFDYPLADINKIYWTTRGTLTPPAEDDVTGVQNVPLDEVSLSDLLDEYGDEVQIFSLSGLHVNVAALEPGIYIVHTPVKVFKIKID